MCACWNDATFKRGPFFTPPWAREASDAASRAESDVTPAASRVAMVSAVMPCDASSADHADSESGDEDDDGDGDGCC